MAEELPDPPFNPTLVPFQRREPHQAQMGRSPAGQGEAVARRGLAEAVTACAKNAGSHPGLMHSMFEAAQRWELIDKNPRSLVRVKGGSKRAVKPPIITSEQFYQVLEFVPVKYRLMVAIAQCHGTPGQRDHGPEVERFRLRRRHAAGSAECRTWAGRCR